MIARGAGVGPATIYKYFGSKDELIFACVQPEVRELGRRLTDVGTTTAAQHTHERLQAFSRTFIGFYLTHRQIGEVVYLTIPARNWVEDANFIQTQQLAVGVEILQQGQERGEVRDDVSAVLLLELMAGAMHRYMMRLLLAGGEADSNAHADLLLSVFWPMLVAQAASKP